MAVVLGRASLRSGTPLLHHLFSFLPGFEGLQTLAVLVGTQAVLDNATQPPNGADFVGVTVVRGVLAILHLRHWRNCSHGRRWLSVRADEVLLCLLFVGGSADAPTGCSLIWVASWVQGTLRQEQAHWLE